MTSELHRPVQEWAQQQQAGLEQWYQETRDALLTVDEHPRRAADEQLTEPRAIVDWCPCPMRFTTLDGSQYVRIHPDELGGP